MLKIMNIDFMDKGWLSCLSSVGQEVVCAYDLWSAIHHTNENHLELIYLGCKKMADACLQKTTMKRTASVKIKLIKFFLLIKKLEGQFYESRKANSWTKQVAVKWFCRKIWVTNFTSGFKDVKQNTFENWWQSKFFVNKFDEIKFCPDLIPLFFSCCGCKSSDEEKSWW